MTEQLDLYGSFAGSNLLPTTIVSIEPMQKLESGGNIDADDIDLPKLLLIQGMSPQMTDGTEGAKPGLFYNTATQKVITPPLLALVVHHHKTRYFKPNAKSEARKPGLQLCISKDSLVGTKYGFCSECALSAWEDNPSGPKNFPPLCALSHNFALMTDDGPLLLRVRTTNSDNSNTCKALLTDLKTGRFRGRELWQQALAINVKPVPKVLDDGQKTTYFVFSLSWERKAEIAEPLQAASRVLHRQLKETYEAGKLATDDNGDDDVPRASARPKKAEFEDTVPF